jgi:hypothetical protein
VLCGADLLLRVHMHLSARGAGVCATRQESGASKVVAVAKAPPERAETSPRPRGPGAALAGASAACVLLCFPFILSFFSV